MENSNRKTKSTEKLHNTNCIRTYTGKYLDVFNPDPEQICIEDIAHALANTCRFGGHTREFYSVAQHSIMVCNRVQPELKLQALMHDAAEAYLTDVPTPIKKQLPAYIELEENLMKVIAAKFGFDCQMAPEVMEADKAELEYEWNEYLIKKNNYATLPTMKYSENEVSALNRYSYIMSNHDAMCVFIGQFQLIEYHNN